MKKSIEKQITGIEESVKKLVPLCEEYLDKEFTEIMQNWANVTFNDILSGSLKTLNVYEEMINEDYIIYLIKAGETDLYYLYVKPNSPICHNNNETTINFYKLSIDIKMNILNNIGSALNKYFVRLQNYIERIKAEPPLDAE